MAITFYDNRDGAEAPFQWWLAVPRWHWGRGYRGHTRMITLSFEPMCGGGQGQLFPAGGFVAVYQIRVARLIADVSPVLQVRTGVARTLRYSLTLTNGAELDMRAPNPPAPGSTTEPPSDDYGLVFLQLDREPRELALEVFFGTEL